jgi:hypothetical protein
MCYTKTLRIGEPPGTPLAGTGDHGYSSPSFPPEGKWASLCAFVTLLFISLCGNWRNSRKRLSLAKTGQARLRPPKPPKLRPIKRAKALLRNFFYEPNLEIITVIRADVLDCGSLRRVKARQWSLACHGFGVSLSVSIGAHPWLKSKTQKTIKPY